MSWTGFQPDNTSVCVQAVRAVAFDAMGVLYSTPDDLAAELIPFALERGCPLTPEDIGRLYRRALIGELSAAALWRALGISSDLDAIEVS